MPFSTWDDESWQSIIHIIRNGNCILMLGGGTSLESSNGTTLPCEEVLADVLYGRIKDKAEISGFNPDTTNIAQLAQYYAMYKDRNLLEASASDFYLQRQDETSELHQNLAALPFKSIISTTFDSMLYNAIDAQEGKTPVTSRFHFCGDNPELVPQGSVEKPLIFNLFGTIDEPDSLVLTEDDFLDLLTTQHALPSNITSLLGAKNKSILFLGFGFHRWYTRVLVHLLKLSPKSNRSYALEQNIPNDNHEFNRTVFFLEKSDYHIHFFNDDIPSFVKTLREKFEKQTALRSAKPPKVFADNAPTAFICHANENKVQAADLYEKLEYEGIRAWIDTQELRGGDQWNKGIETAIKKVDYFLVLQSQALQNKQEGYVNKEIKLAMDRQLNFRASSFIIPLKIDECELLEDLEFLQTHDLTGTNTFANLTKVIKRDWQRRQRTK
jgi:hypothetical protein